MNCMTVDTERGYVSLLGTILDVKGDDLWLRRGLVPPGKKLCVDCGKLIPKENKYGHPTSLYCAGCLQVRYFVTLVCGQCGNEFELSKSEYLKRLRWKKTPLFFCDKRCFGRYIGLKYGIKRKYDYAAVQELWTRTKWTVTKIAAYLGVPRGAASEALQKLQEYRQYRLARRET